MLAAETNNGNKGFSANGKKTRCEMWVFTVYSVTKH